MKAQKVTLIAQAIGMYVMFIPVYLLFLPEKMTPAIVGLSTKVLLTATVTMGSFVSLICIANIALSIVSIYKGEVDPSKTVMAVKLALIPWYLINVVICVICIAIMFNPFMMVGIPVVIAIFVVLGYFYLLGTSIPDVAYHIRMSRAKTGTKTDGIRILTLVALFIFCLDVIASYVFHLQNKTALPPISTSTTSDSE